MKPPASITRNVRRSIGRASLVGSVPSARFYSSPRAQHQLNLEPALEAARCPGWSGRRAWLAGSMAGPMLLEGQPAGCACGSSGDAACGGWPGGQGDGAHAVGERGGGAVMLLLLRGRASDKALRDLSNSRRTVARMRRSIPAAATCARRRSSGWSPGSDMYRACLPALGDQRVPGRRREGVRELTEPGGSGHS
jgi:hypothetical protein